MRRALVGFLVGIGRGCAGTWAWVISPLSGQDGRISWHKVVIGAVLALYWQRVPLPSDVAIWIIAASFGQKVVLALVGRFSHTMASTAGAVVNFAQTKAETLTRTETKNDTRTEAHTITETRQVIARERDAETGEPPKSLPRTTTD